MKQSSKAFCFQHIGAEHILDGIEPSLFGLVKASSVLSPRSVVCGECPCCTCVQSEHDAVKHCIRYLLGAKDLAIKFKRCPVVELEAFSDADHQGEPEENEHPLRSRSSMVVYLRGVVGPTYCQSKLQPTVSRSTAESE
jgi:hypothetical protein